jgi:hypothetical protein
MPKLEWDKPGDREFQTGVDRGVLYLPNGRAVSWNGLTGVDEKFDIEMKTYYQDGVKYLDHQVMGDYSATLKAFTYPDEFEQCIGLATRGSGLVFHDQKPTSFGLSYRTMLGDDLEGLELGYVIHILYNLRAVPGDISYTSIGKDVSPIEFSWTVSGTPEAASGHRPTAHVSINSTNLDFGMIQTIEDILYGTDIDVPYLPSLAELIDTIDNPVSIIDNGDGTWTAIGGASAVSLLSDTVFQVKGIPVNYIDRYTYQIETTD